MVKPFPKDIHFDIVCAILEHLDFKTAKAASLVSRDFYSMWQHWPCFIGFLDANSYEAISLLSNHSGSLMRDVHIHVYTINGSPPLFHSLVGAISRCSALKRLRISAAVDNTMQLAAALASLNSFASRLEWYSSNLGGNEGASFFALHPYLKSVGILRNYAHEPKHRLIELRTPLPLLRRVNFPSAAHLSMLRDSPVTEVELYISQSDNPSDVLAAINTSTVPLERLTLRFSSQRDSPPWYSSLIAHLPALQFLSIHEDWPNLGAQEVDIIAGLPRLETLSLSWRAMQFARDDHEVRNANDPWTSIPPMVKRCAALKRLEMRFMEDYLKRPARVYYRGSSTEAWAIAPRALRHG